MSNTTLRNWLAWRDDYRCARPPRQLSRMQYLLSVREARSGDGL